MTEWSIRDDFLSELERSIDGIRKMQQLLDDLGTYPTGETLTVVLWRSVVLDDECREVSEYGSKWAKLCSMLRQCVDLCHKLNALVQLKRQPRSGKSRVSGSKPES